MKINYINIILMINIIMIDVNIIHPKIVQIYLYLIDKMNLIIICHFANQIVNIKDMIVLIN